MIPLTGFFFELGKIPVDNVDDCLVRCLREFYEIGKIPVDDVDDCLVRCLREFYEIGKIPGENCGVVSGDKFYQVVLQKADYAKH